MILFLDTEFADVLASELVSLALVSDCGRYEFYAEREPLPPTPTDFVRSVVYPLLDRADRALPDPQFSAALHAFFATVRAAARHGKILIAYDFRGDLDLLNYALDGFEALETPIRPAFNALDLGLLGIGFTREVEARFENDATLRRRRHHAFVDAWVNRDAFVADRDRRATDLSEFQRVRESDQELRQALEETFDTTSKAVSWWIAQSRVLGKRPCEAYAGGEREKVLLELAAIRYGIPP